MSVLAAAKSNALAKLPTALRTKWWLDDVVAPWIGVSSVGAVDGPVVGAAAIGAVDSDGLFGASVVFFDSGPLP